MKNIFKRNPFKSLSTLLFASALTVVPIKAYSQNSSVPAQNENKPLSEQLTKSYNRLDSLANISIEKAEADTTDINALEHFLGAESGVYTGSFGRVQTFPKSGEESIVFFDNEPYFTLMQTGFGDRTKANGTPSGRFTAEIKNSVDMSTTYSLMLKDLTDDEIKQTIFLSNGIAPSEQKILRDKYNNLRDIVYTGTAKRTDVSTHRILAEDSEIMKEDIENHILMVPGKVQYFPLKAGLRIAGVNPDDYKKQPLPVIIPVVNPASTEKSGNLTVNNYFMLIANTESGSKEKKVEKSKEDKLEFRVGPLGTITDKGIWGAGFFIQLNKKWDLEVSGLLNTQSSTYSNAFSSSSVSTSESNTENTVQPDNNTSITTKTNTKVVYANILQNASAGATTFEKYNMNLIIARNFGNHNQFFAGAGAALNLNKMNVSGSEVETTFGIRTTTETIEEAITKTNTYTYTYTETNTHTENNSNNHNTNGNGCKPKTSYTAKCGGTPTPDPKPTPDPCPGNDNHHHDGNGNHNGGCNGGNNTNTHTETNTYTYTVTNTTTSVDVNTNIETDLNHKETYKKIDKNATKFNIAPVIEVGTYIGERARLAARWEIPVNNRTFYGQKNTGQFSVSFGVNIGPKDYSHKSESRYQRRHQK